MKLTEDERRFLLKRKWFVRTWRYAGLILIFAISGISLWLYIKSPLLINPFEVASQIESGTLKESTLTIMALITPIMVLTCLLLLMIIIIFAFVAFSNERKYLRIIESLLQENTGRHP